jgi:hypothetical protein
MAAGCETEPRNPVVMFRKKNDNPSVYDHLPISGSIRSIPDATRHVMERAD